MPPGHNPIAVNKYIIIIINAGTSLTKYIEVHKRRNIFSGFFIIQIMKLNMRLKNFVGET